MTRRQATENTAQERVDAAVVDAYERRVAGHAATAEDAALEAEIAAAELSAYVSLHQRVANLPQGDVALGVRSVVLTAAALGAQEHAARLNAQSPLVRALSWIMRPGPLLAAVTAAAVLVAVSVRHEDAPLAGAHEDSAVAMADAPTVQAAPEVAKPAAPALAAQDPAPAAPAPAAAPTPEPPAVVAAPEVPAAAAPPAAPMARPMRTIEAQTASLGPSPADAPTGHAAPREELAKREVAADAEQKPSAGKAKAEVAAADETLQAATASNDRDNAGKKANLANLEQAKLDVANERAGYRTPASGAQAAQDNAPVAAQMAAEPQQKDNAETRNAGTRNQVAGKAAADAVERWRQSVEDAQTPEERVVALKQLVVAAQNAGEDKIAKAAQQALKAAQAQVVARKRAQSLQETPPSQRAKTAPSQGSGELKAQKAKE